MIGGLATLGGAYVFSAILGTAFISQANQPARGPCSQCETFGYLLWVPVVGPWFAAAEADNGAGAFVVLGLAQATGVVLSVIGINQFVTSGDPETKTVALRYLSVTPVQGGAQTTVGLSF